MEMNIALNYTKEDGWQIAYADATGNWHRVATEDFDGMYQGMITQAANILRSMVLDSDDKLNDRFCRSEKAAQQPRDAKGRFVKGS